MTTANVDSSTQRESWVPGDETFGARLALVRQRMGWGNVAEAAQACGIPVPSWRNWERDGRLPRNIVEIAGIISDRTGCDYMWLLSGSRGRLVTVAGVTTAGGPLNGRLARSPVRPIYRRRRPTTHPNGGPRPEPSRPLPAVAATQRRPMLASGPGQRITGRTRAATV